MTETVVARRVAGGVRYEIDTAKDRLDIAMLHNFLSECSHWARGIPLAVMCRSIENSLAFGLYRDGAQIGFARVVTDWATFAYLADVFILPDARNEGLGQWLIETIVIHPPLPGMRRWLLMTRDAASLYRRCGFADPQPACQPLERLDLAVYQPPLAPPKAAAA
jgi:GNAT superfamily N-acetyltransferase